jgi:hypothetical protein
MDGDNGESTDHVTDDENVHYEEPRAETIVGFGRVLTS